MLDPLETAKLNLLLDRYMMENAVPVSEIARLIEFMRCGVKPKRLSCVFGPIIADPSLRLIIAQSEVLLPIASIVAKCLFECPPKTRQAFWSLVCTDDQLVILEHLADIAIYWHVRDAPVSLKEVYEDFASEIADLHLTGKQDTFLRLCIALYTRDLEVMVRLIDTADPRWFTVRCPSTYERALEYSPFAFVRDQLKPNDYFIVPGEPLKIVRDAIGRYAARKFVLPLLCATHPRLGMSPGGNISPASLLADFPHISRYIADVIADDDRALEGVP